MMTDDVRAILRENIFSGNESSFEALTKYVDLGLVTALTGAGVSAPLYPTWLQLLSRTLDDAIRDGLITDIEEIREYRNMLIADPLELADFLEQVRSEHIFRTRLANTFRKAQGSATEAHELISKLNFRGIVTLNYDDGHEAAYANQTHRNPNSGKAQDASTLVRWSQDEVFRDPNAPILHLHGDLSDPKQLVLTSSDYDRFYSQALAESFIGQLWRSHRLLAIGFGFTDPFLTRLAERTLRQIPTDTRHFAFIGRRSGEAISGLARRTFAKKYRVEPVFYEIREVATSEGTSDDHTDLLILLTALQKSEASAPLKAPYAPLSEVLSTGSADREFKSDLFVAPSGRTLYVEPRFESSDDSLREEERLEQSITSITEDSASYIIACRPEFGGTTVARRLIVEFGLRKKKAFLRDAQSLPNYKKRLLEIFQSTGVIEDDPDSILVLDNFDLVTHERLLKELIGTRLFGRIIVLEKQTLFETTSSSLPTDHFAKPYKSLSLKTLRRADVRMLAQQFYQTSDGDLVSAIVEKVYGDLVTLCIPITPANTVMYLTILFKDGDFQPINRVQIVNRYLTNLLVTSSDLQHDSFNAKNKLDVLSAFVFSLYESNKLAFSEADWFSFCRNHMKATLSYFDERQLLNVLKTTRVFVPLANQLFFKYSFFHTFFLGRYIAAKSALLAACIESTQYLRHSGLVEVIADLASDNEQLISDIVEKANTALGEFDSRYISERFDPFADFGWPTTPLEQEQLWNPLSQKLAAGPRNPKEIDEIKSSFGSESRANNQRVSVQDFDRSERRLIALHVALTAAMKNGDNLPAGLKRRAVSTLFKGYFRMFQIGMMLSSTIASQPFVRWHGLCFINFSKTIEVDDKRRIVRVMVSLLSAIAQKGAEDIGSKKLGEAFKEFASAEILSGFVFALNFACLIRAKPKDWFEAASGAIAKTGRNTFYLSTMLEMAFTQFNDEVNTTSERESLKRLIAVIAAKRGLKKQNPGTKDVEQFVGRLEKSDFFKDPIIPAVKLPSGENK